MQFKLNIDEVLFYLQLKVIYIQNRKNFQKVLKTKITKYFLKKYFKYNFPNTIKNAKFKILLKK